MMNLEKLGWIIAAAVAGAMLASGFQGAFDKVATVDLNTLMDSSDIGKANATALDTMRSSRLELLKFIQENRVLTIEEAKNLRTLWLKDNQTAGDKANLESLKAQIVAEEKNNIALGQKGDLKPEERTLLQQFASRSAATDSLLSQWDQEFTNDFQQSVQDRRVDELNKAKTAAKAVAKANGCSLVFDSSVAVYAPNDLTDAALKAMNGKS